MNLKDQVHSCTVLQLPTFKFCDKECRKIPMATSEQMGDLLHAIHPLERFLRSDNIYLPAILKAQVHNCTVVYLPAFNVCDEECSKFQWPCLNRWVISYMLSIHSTDFSDHMILLTCNPQQCSRHLPNFACYWSAGQISQIRCYYQPVIHNSAVGTCPVSLLHTVSKVIGDP